MKIRTDYVSNSSSSSFIILGDKLKTGYSPTIDDIASLPPDSKLIAYIPDAGCEGGYMFSIEPELLMDCDFRQIKLVASKNIEIFNAKYVMCSWKPPMPARLFESIINESKCHYGDNKELDSATDSMWELVKTEGLKLDGIRFFSMSVDNDNPTYRQAILDSIETFGWVN